MSDKFIKNFKQVTNTQNKEAYLEPSQLATAQLFHER